MQQGVRSVKEMKGCQGLWEQRLKNKGNTKIDTADPDLTKAQVF